MAVPSETTDGKKVLFLIETRYSANEESGEFPRTAAKKYKLCEDVMERCQEETGSIEWIFVYVAHRQIKTLDRGGELLKRLCPRAVILDRVAVSQAYGETFNSRVML